MAMNKRAGWKYICCNVTVKVISTNIAGLLLEQQVVLLGIRRKDRKQHWRKLYKNECYWLCL